MADLVHWPGERADSEGASRSDSPFWAAMQRTIDDSSSIGIACPYLAPSYVDDIVNDVEEWRLLTDVQAWLRVYGGDKQAAIEEFVHAYESNIRHVPGLHAKAIIADDSALLGSANLTRNGIVERQELGVRLTDDAEVTSLQAWFDDIWSNGQRIREGVLPGTGTAAVAKKGPERTDDEVPVVFDRLQDAPSREWVNSLLDLMGDAIRASQLGEGDSRLVTSVAQDDRIVVAVNNRYVCGGFFDSTPRVGFILSDEFEGVNEAVRRSVSAEYYRFSTRDGLDPHWVEFDDPPNTALSRNIRPAWLSAIENEVDRGTRSQYRDHHDPRVYRLILEDGYRETVLSSLFD